MNKEWLTANVDWPRLQKWFPSLSFGDLRLARTEIQMTMTNNVFHMLAKATYPEAVSWQAQPWKVPKHLASGELVSFTAAQDIAPFLKRDVLAGMSTDPFTQQYYCFAMSQMPFQNYMAWPVDNATNLLDKLKTEAPAVLGPAVQQLNSGTIVWNDKKHQLDWVSGEAQPTAPYLEAREDDGQAYLLAGLFPLLRPRTNGPPSLFAQFENRGKVVYYDWENTGPRLQEWRFLSEMLPIVPRPTAAYRKNLEAAEAKQRSLNATNHARARILPSYMVADNWLAGIAPHLGITITEVEKTGPAELTIRRRSPFLFTALEWTLLTHWLGQTPVGPMDRNLLPPPAKVTAGFGATPPTPTPAPKAH